MSGIVVGSLGLVMLFALIILHTPIGVAMALTGVTMVGYLIGFGPALSLFGAEGKGLRRLTLENCDYHAKISGNSTFSSLNVSTAVGITLNSLLSL